MKRLIAFAIFMMLAASLFADQVELQADTTAAYSPDTSTAGTKVIMKPSAGEESTLTKAVLIASTGYLNYAYIADNRLGYGLLFDSALIAGTLCQHFSYDPDENRQSIFYEMSGIVSSLGMAGLTYYPLYELYESYTYKDYRHTSRGWIGCGVLVIDMIVLSSEKYEAVPIGLMYNGIKAEVFLNLKY